MIMSFPTDTNHRNEVVPRLPLGLSSYRLTFQNHIALLSRATYISDEKFFNLMANMLRSWFKYEPIITNCKSGESVVDILRERGLL